MPHIQRLAQELIDRIIDEFGLQFPLGPESRRTLISCTAVCQAFRPRSQQLLWTDIRITNGTSAVPNFLSKLASNPSIFYHLRALRLGFDKETRDVNTVQEILNLIKAHEVGLQHLGICYDNEDTSHPLHFADDSSFLMSLSYFGASASLTTLHLKYLSVYMDHLSKFINLKTLILERCSFRNWDRVFATTGSDAPQARIFLPSLEALHIIRCLENFSSMFNSDATVQCGNLKSFHCIFQDRTDPHPVRKFLGSPGVDKTLETLELVEVTRMWEFRNPFSEPLYLNKLQNLRHLKLKTVMANPYGRLNSCPNCGFLSSKPYPGWAKVQNPSTTIERVEIVIDTPFWDDAPDSQLLDFLQNDRHWKSIDADLADLNVYPSLYATKILLCLRAPSESDKALTLDGVKEQLGHALHFPILESSPTIALTVGIIVGDSLA